MHTNSCFAVGTLIHTRGGTVPIETIEPGTEVLSQPDSRGEHGFKRVLRTFSFDDKAVMRLTVYGLGAAEQETQNLIVTGNHPFFVAGYDRDSIDPDFYDMFMQNTGWRRADQLDRGALLEQANGETVRVGGIDQIWRTKTEGIGWIQADPESMIGWHIDLRDGGVVETPSIPVISEFAMDTTFRDRFEDAELAGHWAYKCKVFNFDVEDFHTYYVGAMGLWVHSQLRTSPEK
jgi:hypothetical protein